MSLDRHHGSSKEDEVEHRRPALEEREEERGDRARAEVVSRALVDERFGAGGLLAPRALERAMSRNPHWVAELGIRPASFGTDAGPASAEFAQAVAAFQQAHGLPVDGVAGPRTHHSLMTGLLEPSAGGDWRAAGRSRELLEPGVLSDADLLEPGVLGDADLLEPGTLKEGGDGPMAPGEGGKTRPPRSGDELLEPGVLSDADLLEPGVLGGKTGGYGPMAPGEGGKTRPPRSGDELLEPEPPHRRSDADELE
jgi:hypothetical protein